MNPYEIVPVAELLVKLFGYKAALEASTEDLEAVTENTEYPLKATENTLANATENTLHCKYWQGAKDVIDYISPSIALLIESKEVYFEDIFREGWDCGDELICDLEE